MSLGRTYFTYTAVDNSGNSAACTFTGTVTKAGAGIDTLPPVINNCPKPEPYTYVFATDPGMPTASASWPLITATDPLLATFGYITNPTGLYRGAGFPVGNNSVKFVATNLAGNSAECDFYVVVLDLQPPTVKCPNSFIQNCLPPYRSANVSWVLPSFSDNVAILQSTVTRSPGLYAAGTYQVVASAVDTSGNTANCSFTFTVVTDTATPVVACPRTQVVDTDVNKSIAIVSWSPPAISDSWGIGSATYSPNQYYPPAAFKLGVTTVNFTVVDLFFNKKVCYFNITVLDKQSPTISCPKSFSIQIPTGSESVQVNWQAPAVHDNVACDVTTQSLQPLAYYGEGVYTVVAFVNDTSGNISPPCNFTFTVIAAYVPPPSNSTQSSSSSASSSAVTAAAAGGAAGGLLLIVVLVVVIWHRRQQALLQKLEEQYGNVDMSDEAVLARAQAIQQALQNKKRNAAPNLKWLQIPPIRFQPPPKEMSQMSVYLAQYADKELPRSDVVIENEIGAGEFGSVCGGYYRRPDGSKRTIAIKTLKDSRNLVNKLKFLQEASIMIQFRHPKIVELVGVVTKNEPVLICLEFMELGSLRTYLKSELVFEQLSDADLIRMACDVCSAMHYLGESGFVHRDLAARNVLINKDFVCKVCDFGLSQEVGDVSGNSNEEKIPIRWTAPEAVMNHKFSVSSDVWSFGILLWEMWSYGAMPYKGWTNDVVMANVNKDYRMPCPKACPSFIHALMLECWNQTATHRPTFYDAFQRLLAAWSICKPITHYAKTDAYGEASSSAPSSKSSSNTVKIHQNPAYAAQPKRPVLVTAPEEEDEGDTYDLGGEGGKIAAPQIEFNELPDRHEVDDDEDTDMYDLGGTGGQIRAQDDDIVTINRLLDVSALLSRFTIESEHDDNGGVRSRTMLEDEDGVMGFGDENDDAVLAPLSDPSVEVPIVSHVIDVVDSGYLAITSLE